MKGTNSMFDIIIIGSGPAGLSAAIYAKRANLNVAVAEKEYEGTGQIAESGNVCYNTQKNFFFVMLFAFFKQGNTCF